MHTKDVEEQQLFAFGECEGVSNRGYAWVFVMGNKVSW